MTLAPTVPIWVKPPAPAGRRSIRNCVSLLLLSLQWTCTDVGESGVAAGRDGGAGTVGATVIVRLVAAWKLRPAASETAVATRGWLPAVWKVVCSAELPAGGVTEVAPVQVPGVMVKLTASV